MIKTYTPSDLFQLAKNKVPSKPQLTKTTSWRFVKQRKLKEISILAATVVREQECVGSTNKLPLSFIAL